MGEGVGKVVGEEVGNTRNLVLDSNSNLSVCSQKNLTAATYNTAARFLLKRLSTYLSNDEMEILTWKWTSLRVASIHRKG